jgi:hypothetical protein
LFVEVGNILQVKVHGLLQVGTPGLVNPFFVPLSVAKNVGTDHVDKHPGMFGIKDLEGKPKKENQGKPKKKNQGKPKKNKNVILWEEAVNNNRNKR